MRRRQRPWPAKARFWARCNKGIPNRPDAVGVFRGGGAARQWMGDSDQDDDMSVIALKGGTAEPNLRCNPVHLFALLNVQLQRSLAKIDLKMRPFPSLFHGEGEGVAV